MRIVQIAASVAESDGGTTTVVLGLHDALRRIDGVETRSLATDSEGPKGQLTEQERNRLSAYPGLSVYPRSRPLRLKHSWALARAIWSETRSADLVCVHGLYLAHSVWAWLAARWHKRPFLVFPHGVLEPYQARSRRTTKSAWDRVVGHRILTDAAALVAASAAELANLQRDFPTFRVIEAPLGTSEGPATVREADASKLGPWLAVPRHKRVLFLGRLARKKRPDLLLDAWNRCSSGILAVVGPDDYWSADELRQLIQGHRKDSTLFPGPTEPAGVRWYMSHAGVFVLPSENENFGLTIAEAMAGGATVVTTRQAAASQHVDNAGAGVVLDSPDANTLAAAIDALMSDPARQADASAAGHSYARQHLTWDATAQGLLTASRELAAERNPAAPHSTNT